MKKKLYIKSNGEYEEIDSFLLLNASKPIIKTSIAEAISKYLKTVTVLKCEANHSREKVYLEHLRDNLKVKYLGEISMSDMECHRRRMITHGLKNSSIERRFQVFNHFFKKCIDWGFLNESPTQKLKSLKIEKNPRKIWSDEVLEKVFKSLPSPYKEYLLFMYLTGARQREINNLKWTDIDYDDKIIIFKSLKNAKTSREFPMTPEVDVVLHRLKITGSYVFSSNGKMMSTDSLYQAVKHRLKALGYDNLVPYGLRHTFANRLSKQGVNAFFIQKLLGHADIRTTLNYVNPDKKDLLDALSNIKTKTLIKAN